MDVDDEDDMEELTHVNTRWSKDEEKLLEEIWVEVSQDKDIGNDGSEEFFGNKIVDMFNSLSVKIIPKIWARVNGQGLTVIVKISTLFTNICSVEVGKMTFIISRMQRPMLNNALLGEASYMF